LLFYRANLDRILENISSDTEKSNIVMFLIEWMAEVSDGGKVKIGNVYSFTLPCLLVGTRVRNLPVMLPILHYRKIAGNLLVTNQSILQS